MSLQNWLQIGHLTNHQATVAEVKNLLGVVDREIADASVAGLSDDGRFTHAYDAALQLCKLALHASGFEVAKRAQGIMLFGSIRWNLRLAPPTREL